MVPPSRNKSYPVIELVHSLGSIKEFVVEIFALVPTINLHSLRSDKIHLLSGTLTASLFSTPNDFFNFLSFNGKITVSCPGQNFSTILVTTLSNSTMFSKSSFE